MNPLLLKHLGDQALLSVRASHLCPIMLQHLHQGTHPDASDTDKMNLLRNIHNALMSAANWSPRSYSFLNMPKEAKAGEKRSVSPGSVMFIAAETASERV